MNGKGNYGEFLLGLLVVVAIGILLRMQVFSANGPDPSSMPSANGGSETLEPDTDIYSSVDSGITGGGYYECLSASISEKPLDMDWKVEIEKVDGSGEFYFNGYVDGNLRMGVFAIVDSTLNAEDSTRIKEAVREGETVFLSGRCVGTTEENKVLFEISDFAE